VVIVAAKGPDKNHAPELITIKWAHVFDPGHDAVNFINCFTNRGACTETDVQSLNKEVDLGMRSKLFVALSEGIEDSMCGRQGFDLFVVGA
jgi:hypothetical protein